MSASAETALNTALHRAVQARTELDKARAVERRSVVAFMDEALYQRTSWEKIGEALGVSGTGARRYYQRNRRQVRSV